MPRSQTNPSRKVEGWIDDLVGALFDPIIVYPPWGEDIPEWLKTKITMERLIENMVAVREGREVTATDAEAMWYLSSASLSFPLDHDWTEIYLYLATTELKDKGLPEDIKVESLREDQWRDLNRLKDWIYRTRAKRRKEKARAERRKKVDEKKEQLTQLQARFF